MKKFVSLVFVFGMFAFIAPCVSAMPVTGVNSTVEQNQVKSVIKIPPKRLYEPAVQNNIISIGKREKSHGTTYQIPKRLYEPAVQNNIISIGKREKSHGTIYQIPKRLYEPAFPDSIV